MLTTLPQSQTLQPTPVAPAETVTSGRRAWIWLAAFTLIAGGLRFTLLERPTLWHDEAMTVLRVCGSYKQMLNFLQVDGFGPLHYELYWVIARFVDLSPFTMRFVSALSGTLMVPAMYFLAIHLVARRTALLTAAITATSAFMLYYSRDAKMYAPFWLFVTLHVGCMFWWFRTGRRVAWLSWLTTGLAMVGLHGLGLIILALEPIFLLTYWPPSWRRPLLMLLGLAIIMAGPLGYFAGFNRVQERMEKRGFKGSPVFWVPHRNAGATGPQLLFDSTCAYLFAWQWIVEVKDLAVGANPVGAATQPSYVPAIPAPLKPERVTAAMWAAFVLLGWLALGLVPWPQHWRPWGWERLAPHPWWRTAFWLSVWIVLPTYGMYCASMRQFVPPTYWIDALLVELHRPIVLILTVAIAATGIGIVWIFAPDYFLPHVLRARIGKLIALLMVLAAVFGLCHGVYAIARHIWEGFVVQALKDHPEMTRAVAEQFVWENRWFSMWIPRYLGLIWPAVAIAVAALIMRLPFRPMRWAAIACFMGINLFQGTLHAYVASSEPPVDRIAADVNLSRDPAGSSLTYVNIPRIGLGNPGTATLELAAGRYYLYRAHGVRPSPAPAGRGYAQFPFRVLTATAPSVITTDLAKAPNVNRLIVWDRVEVVSPDYSDQLGSLLGSEWERVSEEIVPVRVHWSWQDLYQARRREYAKKGTETGSAGTTQPTTAPR